MPALTFRAFRALRARLTPAALALAALVVFSASLPAEAASPRVTSAATRARVVELVNEARVTSRRCGKERFAATRPLTASRQLNEAAADHARDMARRNYFDHRARDGSQPWDRIRRAGYKPRISGENIAFGPESAEEVVAGWLNSPGHCANIMDPRFTQIGVGVAIGAKRGRIYWVQTFGAPLDRR